MSRKQTKVTENQKRSIIAQYNKGGEGNGLVAIAKRLELGVQIIRRVLVEADVTIRGKGRPCLAK